MPVQEQPADARQSALDLLILKALSLQTMHGWGISQRIQQLSRDVLQINQGTLYPALHRLERRGDISAAWEISENNRRARYYRLTADGRRRLTVERGDWARYIGAVERVLRAT
jgi:PadR family transcriptional regulator